jgi:hypothetical protein
LPSRTSVSTRRACSSRPNKSAAQATFRCWSRPEKHAIYGFSKQHNGAAVDELLGGSATKSRGSR